ncbi:ATP-binding protein [Geothrix sp. 21YS21S-2]|uniref:ATP-binding protein n=1 Tax=Geothrix sp. 21YS21S-2 TaxID=3068893 RepID=UPI0027BA54E4|nr:ATP-binding protein [Geothrix sp. 21YS21S-2]
MALLMRQLFADRRLRSQIVRRAVLWTLVVAVIIGTGAVFSHRETRAIALGRARDSFQKDVTTRQWVTQRGGVYVPLDERTAPNPHLAHVRDREIITTSGKVLTLVNPAYLTRMLHELGREKYGLQGHITSLKPIRAANAADPWEVRALRALETGAAEFYEESPVDGRPTLRFMGALVTQEGCLRCHASQGYQVGDVRGGISVTVPMPRGSALVGGLGNLPTLIVMGAVWSVGLIVILLAGRWNLARLQDRQRSETERDLLQAQLAQAQKMESLGALAGGVAHDMNNVLGAILGLASATVDRHAPGDPTRRALETIIKAAERGGKTVRGLLSFARQSPAEERDLDLNGILQEEARLLEHTTLARVALTLDLAPDLRPIRGDASALSHALMNLCVNAVDAMPQGGTLALRTRNVDGDWIELSVEDTGEGMPPAVLERALDPFFTTKDVGRGTGLGLSLVYSTVKAHLGQLEIQSEPGRGTRVRMRFPVSESAAQQALEAQEAREAAQPGALRVLLVDDDELIQYSIRTVLEVLGHAATAVSSGEEALRLLEGGFQPQVVILDMNMPGLGGPGTLPRLRALRPDLPVLLATGRADPTAMDLAEAHPQVKLLSKPFTMEDLRRELQRLRG